jgi:hypothetical protein
MSCEDRSLLIDGFRRAAKAAAAAALRLARIDDERALVVA